MQRWLRTTEKDTFCIEEPNEKNSSDAWVEKNVYPIHTGPLISRIKGEESGKVQLPRKTRIMMIDPRASSFKNFLLRSSNILKIQKKKKEKYSSLKKKRIF